MYGLREILLSLSSTELTKDESINLPKKYITPGCWVVIAAIAKIQSYRSDRLIFADKNQEDYAKAIKLHLALDGTDPYPNHRKRSGVNYSPLAKLDSESSTNFATTEINGCVRSICGGNSDSLSELLNVIGELHDNVWSHGKDTGFSMAQKYQDYRYEEDILEFALADTGYGFLAEMKRVGSEINSHADAIKWCIQEGNTTKSSNHIDEFAQRVPDDIIGGSPYGYDIETFTSSNHHQGLGLYKLLELIKEYSGELFLASGDSGLHIDFQGNRNYIAIPNWKGVAISCKFKESELTKSKPTKDLSPQIIDIMKKLRREK